jgi:hypothetical protein
MQCRQTKRDGARCRAKTLVGKKFCALHAEPGRAAEIGRKGGHRRAQYPMDDLKEFAAPKTASDLRDLLAESIIEIRSGRLDPKIANALGYLGASYLRALEVSDIESRMDALEAAQRAERRMILQSTANQGGKE